MLSKQCQRSKQFSKKILPLVKRKMKPKKTSFLSFRWWLVLIHVVPTLLLYVQIFIFLIPLVVISSFKFKRKVRCHQDYVRGSRLDLKAQILEYPQSCPKNTPRQLSQRSNTLIEGGLMVFPGQRGYTDLAAISGSTQVLLPVGHLSPKGWLPDPPQLTSVRRRSSSALFPLDDRAPSLISKSKSPVIQ